MNGQCLFVCSATNYEYDHFLWWTPVARKRKMHWNGKWGGIWSDLIEFFDNFHMGNDGLNLELNSQAEGFFDDCV